jgi:hypothetical protein
VGLAVGVALGLRSVVFAGVAELLLAAGWLAVATHPAAGRYVARNLPPGGTLVLTATLGLLVAGLIEAAAPETGRPLLAVLAGVAGLLAGVLSAGLLASRFRTGLAERGYADSDQLRWFDQSSTKFRRLVAKGESATIGLLGLIVLALVWEEAGSGPTSAPTGLAVAFAVGGLTVGSTHAATLVRAGRGSARTRRRIAAAVAASAPELLVHFSGGVATLYQLAHWLPAVEATGRPWMIVFRESATFDAAVHIERAVLVEDFGDLDLVMVDSVRAVLYVNTATKNNHVVRFDDPLHIQLHHGDSDKPPSSGKTMRLYDVHFVAGSAARARLEAAGVAAPRIFEVGRPITDSLPTDEEAPPAVLYAPTWEGAHADSNFSSLAAHGEKIVRSIAATGRTLIFRPHPLSGTADAAAAAARRRLGEMVTSLGGLVDQGERELVAAFGAAGLLICDVSSVLVDWYATGRPVLVTDVAGLGEDEVWRRYPTTRGARVIAASLEDLADLVAEAFSSDLMRTERARTAARMLGEIGGAQERFDAALAAVIRPR